MKLLFCLNKDVYSILCFNKLITIFVSFGKKINKKDNISPNYKLEDQIKIYFSDQVGKSPQNYHLRSLQQIEQDLSMSNILSFADIANLDINKNKFLSYLQIKEKFQIFDFCDINHDGYQYLKQNWQPDIILSIRFGQIFSGGIINLPKFGIFNLHSGILPQYRGIMATFWAMLNQEQEMGTTLHLINNNQIDKGPVIGIYRKRINYNQSFISNLLKLYEGSIFLIEDLLIKVFANQSSQYDHNSSLKNESSWSFVPINYDLCGQYFSYPKDSDINKFLANKYVLY